MNRTIIFAHYDKENIIDECTIYYLKELQKISSTIIFVSDCNIEEQELNKLKDITEFVHAKKHGEYDFGSYKIGWKIAKENGLLENSDYLYFVNDSCIGPFHPIEKAVDEMESKPCDFWGITDNKNRIKKFIIDSPSSNNHHIQSYFVVFKKQVFDSDVFKNFMENITKEKNKTDIIIKYEIGLTKALCEAGFSYNVYESTDIININIQDLIDSKKKDSFILLKKSMIKSGYYLDIFEKKQKSEIYKNIISSYKKRVTKQKNLNEKIKAFLFYIKIARKQYISIHFKEKSVFFCGKWYNWKKCN